jgi:hypothetical protein
VQQLALALREDEAWRAPRSRSTPSGREAPRAVAARRATSAASVIWFIESRNFAATSPVSPAPVRSAHAWRRSANDGAADSTSSTVRSPSASAAVRVGAARTVRSGRCSIARSSRPRSAGSMSSSPSKTIGRSSSADTSEASAIASRSLRSRTCSARSGRP